MYKPPKILDLSLTYGRYPKNASILGDTVTKKKKVAKISEFAVYALTFGNFCGDGGKTRPYVCVWNARCTRPMGGKRVLALCDWTVPKKNRAALKESRCILLHTVCA